MYKNYAMKPVMPPGYIHKILLVMRLTTVILIASLMQVSASGLAQRITLNQRNVNLETILKEIRKQTSYDFYYDRNVVQNTAPVDINVKNATVEETLDRILAVLPLTYTIDGKLVSIKPKEPSFLEKVVDRITAPFSAIDVSGKVLDSDGRPLPGATVTVKGTKISTTTQNDGSFTLGGVENDAILVISYMGFEQREVKAESNIGSVRLIASTNPLDEVQVIAYGTTTRRLSTGNIGTVKAEDIEKQPVNNPLLALQGRVSGIVITQNSGIPGGGITVRIQGRNSINSGNDPLYVIDGVPILSQLPAVGGMGTSILGNSGTVAPGNPTTAGNPLSFLNPLDIESIDVLKDADATAIYGSRAANGAILITTKKGRIGKMQAEINIQQGISYQPARLEVLNTRQYLDMRYEALKNNGISLTSLTQTGNHDLTVWDTTRYTNWQDELLGKAAPYLTASASISGGSTAMNYLLSGTYGKEGVAFPGDFGNRRASLNFSMSSISLNNKLKLRFSGNFSNNNKQLPVTDPTSAALFIEPNSPAPFKDDGTLNWEPNNAGVSTFTSNPYINLTRLIKEDNNNFLGNWTIGYQILPGLEISNSLGYNYGQTKNVSTTPRTAIRPEVRTIGSPSYTPNSATYGNGLMSSWITEPQLNYKFRIGKGDLNALVGGTISGNNVSNSTLIGNTYTSDATLENIGSAATVSANASSILEYRYSAVFGRLNYNLDNQYIVNITARRDGSSRFGENNSLHNFGAVGAAWIFSKSHFAENNLPWLSFGKLRGSYGTTGNDQIADYGFISRYFNAYAELPYQNIASLTPFGLPNPNLRWEFTKKLSAGMNLGFINDRILFNVDYSSNTTVDQLVNYTLPSITGFSGYTNNFPGKVRNKTWEFSLTTEIIKSKALIWTNNFNINIARNILVSYPDLATSPYADMYEVGKSLDIVRLLTFAGVNPANGMYLFKKSNGELTENPDYLVDRHVINLNPDWHGGMQNNIKYQGFSLDFFIQFVKQNGQNTYLGNGGAAATPGAFSRGASNQPLSILERWRSFDDNSSIKKVSSQVQDASTSTAYFSDAGFSDASFARLKNISLSWQVPVNWLQKVGASSMKVFINMQNVLTITSYKGLDPEKPGIRPLMPPMRTLVFGANLGF
ncbi:SusC/RagA family TonB-linked outer membrane protein [Pedobacter chinensis]|nr:SusC/RagA family TonB-linked outer membrane protein [Pedobacter chinensis]